VIGFGWVQIRKGKLCGRILKTYQIQNESNLENIFKSYLGYCDLEGLHKSPNYFEKLRKKFICNDSTTWSFNVLIIFTSTERLWDPFFKSLHTLHASRLNL